MEINYSVLKECVLFNGIEIIDYNSILSCLNTYTKKYLKGENIINNNSDLSRIGIVISGNAQIIKEDYFGNQNILANIVQGETFGESFVASDKKIPYITIIAKEDSEILFIDYKKIINMCSNACIFHNKLIENMLKVSAIKNVNLTQKIQHMSEKTIQNKLLSYLSAQALVSESNSFKIPFNRQELANYLSIDRSAMSKELSNLRKLGIISFHKNNFTILKNSINS